MRAWVIVIVAACGDNAIVPDARRPIDLTPIDTRELDAPPGTPDLTLIAAEMDNTIQIATQGFNGAACEVVEQCVGGPGLRTLLKFDTVTANLGTADLVVGIPPAAGID